MACDFFVSRSKQNINYLIYAFLSPSDISSISNCILSYSPSLFDGILVFIDPIYLFYAPNSFSNYLQVKLIYNELILKIPELSDDPFIDHEAILFKKHTIPNFKGMPNHFNIDFLSFIPGYLLDTLNTIASLFSNILYAPYLNGYKNNHTPGLNGFWYLHVCMVKQYSKLCYSLMLVFSGFLIAKEPRLFPIFRNHSSFISFLPFIKYSKYLNIYFVLSLGFEYIFMLFRTIEITNTNFLYWIVLIFNILYIYDIRFGSLKKHELLF